MTTAQAEYYEGNTYLVRLSTALSLWRTFVFNQEFTGSSSDALSDDVLDTALCIATAGLVYSIYLVNTAYPVSGPALLAAVGGSTSNSLSSVTISASAPASTTGASNHSPIWIVPTTFQTDLRTAAPSSQLNPSPLKN